MTGGFTAKFLVFWGAMVNTGDYGNLFRWLALIGALNAAAGAYYYLRLVARMYLHPAHASIEGNGRWPVLATLWICAVVTLFLGIYPGPLVSVSIQSAGVQLLPQPASDERAWIGVPPQDTSKP
jgi:NADH-quinone oxidoreductase subunit N